MTAQEYLSSFIERSSDEQSIVARASAQLRLDMCKGAVPVMRRSNKYASDRYLQYTKKRRKQLHGLDERQHDELTLVRDDLKKCLAKHIEEVEASSQFEVRRVTEGYDEEFKKAEVELCKKKNALMTELLTELEEQRRNIQVECDSTVLEHRMSGYSDATQVVTRKLRKRANAAAAATSCNPVSLESARHSMGPKRLCSAGVSAVAHDSLLSSVNWNLKEDEMTCDLYIVSKGEYEPAPNQSPQRIPEEAVDGSNSRKHHSVYVEGRNLIYNSMTFCKGQHIYLEGNLRCNCSIINILPSEIQLKKSSDNTRLRITLEMLRKGTYRITLR